MSIRKRLASCLFIISSLIVIMGCLSILGGQVIVHAFRKSLIAMNSYNDIREFKTNIERQKTSLNRYLLLGDSQEFVYFQEYSGLAKKNLEGMERSMGINVPKWLPKLNEQYQAVLDSSVKVARLYQKGKKAQAIDQATTTLYPLLQEFTENTRSLEKEKAEEAQSMFSTSQTLTNNASLIVLIVFAVTVIFGFILFRLLYRAVINPVEALKTGANEFGKGHWDHRINLPSSNEFGALARSFNTMAENVRQLQLQAIHMDRMSAVGQLAGGVAHEINNPLTGVLGQAQILLAKLKETDPTYTSLRKIEQAALRCKKIVRGLLDFSRPTQSNFERIDTSHVVRAALDLCEADIKRSRVLVNMQVANNLPKIDANASELQQILLNLINNALQAMPRGGTLTIKTHSHNETLTLVDRRKGIPPRVAHGPWVEITVGDTGVGISKEHLPRVFEPFFTTKEIGKGTGLGLAVSMGIVKKHGGDLMVESQGMNRGTTFRLTLPINRSHAPPASGEFLQGLAA